MTREQLADRFRVANRRSWWVLGPWLVIFFGILFGLRGNASNEPLSIPALLGFFAFLALNLVAVVIFNFRLMRHYGLFCSRCNKVLDSQGIEIALATGTCNRCKQTFLD